MQKVTFSGIQPSGNLHIGNYLGAIRHWVNNQKDGLNIFCVVDMHAITIEQKPHILREKTIDTVILLLASGINPDRSILFVQSKNPDHANLAWILNCNIFMGQMSRMTQYKQKSQDKKSVSVGLFDYPALMAADILLYNTTHVPVGEDQKQHVELARDVAERFNFRYGETFILPRPVIAKNGARIMSLQNPLKKMSKSDPDINASIFLLDEPDAIAKKISMAVTDSGNEVMAASNKPGITNLLVIYSEFSQISLETAQEEFVGKTYRDFKARVSEVVIEKLRPIQRKYVEIKSNEKKLHELIEKWTSKAYSISHKKLEEIYDKVGFVK